MTAYSLTDVVSVDNFPAVQEITGSVVSSPAPATAPNITVFTGSTVSTTFLAANPARMGAIFTNDECSSGSIYLKFGAVASTGSYTVKLKQGAYYEVPFRYIGRIDGIWNTSSGTLFVTELLG
jgi:hypothetical protein